METQFDDIIRRVQQFPLTTAGLDALYQEMHKDFDLAESFDVGEDRHNGFLIAFDGHCGAGKDTQIRALSQRLRDFLPDSEHLVVSFKKHNVFHRISKYYWLNAEQFPGSDVGFALNVCGRRNTTFSTILPALCNGKIVITNRSALSAAVYMAETAAQVTDLLQLTAEWDVCADLAFVLECDTSIAYDRVMRRAPEKNNVVYINETPPFIDKAKALFASFAHGKPYMRVVETNGGTDSVSDEIGAHVQKGLAAWKRSS